MMSVVISINGKTIFTRTAVNRSKVGSNTSKPQPYEVDTGEIVTHIPDDGAVKLAHKLLDTIKEQK